MSQNKQPTLNGLESGFLAPLNLNELSVPSAEYDKPQDECGVFAVYAPGEAVCQIAYQGMKALQHRGQSAAGIAYFDNGGFGLDGSKQMVAHKGIGLVDEAIGREVGPNYNGISRIDAMSASHVAIGHTRYSTSESNDLAAVHPFMPGVAIAHNGHFDLEMLAPVADAYDIDLANAPSDSAGFAQLLDTVISRKDGDVLAALHELLPQINGAYNLVIAHQAGVYAVRDPWGYHPLTLGQLQNSNGYVVASESIALKSVGAEFVRDIEPGEIVFIGEDGVVSERISRVENEKNCGFEYIYTARPDGIVNGVSVYRARKNLGHALAVDSPAEADVVVGVPMSGLTAASGYSEMSGLPRVEGIIKNTYVNRTFIERGSSQSSSLEEKFHLITDEIAGQRVVLVDDSVIKGKTMKQLVKMVRDAGATEVHVRSSAPHYMYPCYMGMDTGNISNLVARNMTDAEICDYIGADSIAFNSVERLKEAISDAQIDPMQKAIGSKLCLACLTGDYPMPVPESPPARVELPLPRLRTVIDLGGEALSAASAS